MLTNYLFTPNYFKYYLFSTGTKLKNKYYNNQRDALDAMYKYCYKNNIELECTEDDIFGKKYSNHKGVRFYINKVLA